MSTNVNLVMRIMGSILVFRNEDYKCLINFCSFVQASLGADANPCSHAECDTKILQPSHTSSVQDFM